MTERGRYVVIEGNDGTGKSTQVEILAAHLKKHRDITSFIAHEPAGTPVADAIREIIKNGELARSPETNLLLFTASRHEIWQRAKRELELGHWVLSARNYLSTIAYQGSGEGLSEELILDTTKAFTDDQYMNPDHTIILTLDDDSRRLRIGNRGELEKPDTFESRDQMFQDRVNDSYKRLAAQYGYTTIDASQSREEIMQHIILHLPLD